MKDYEDYDGLGLADLVKRKKVGAAELLEAAIARAEAREPELNAIVFKMYDQAKSAIEAGLPTGPFEGVPFLLKDLHLSWPGVPLTNGSSLFRNTIPDVESELVRRYRDAGLVIFGKTHSPEFGLTTSTESRVFGQTHNPWKLEFTSGGSSGGASAAVSAGYLPLANASDGGGSIRIPASCCGLFGMKPTRGRTPMGPHSGEGWSGMSAVHAVTRSVRDSAALLDATSGADLGAPYAAQPPPRPFLAEVSESPGKLRISVQRQTFNGLDPDPECIDALEDAIDLCRALGHDVLEVPFEVEDATRLGQATTTIIGANTLAAMQDEAARQGKELSEDDVEPGSWAFAEFARPRSAVDYVGAVRTIHAAGRALARHLEGFDAVLSPTMATPPARLGVLSPSNPDISTRMVALLKSSGYTQLGNSTGCPGMSVPLYWSDTGLPIGVQFMGRINDEATLYRLAGQLETARPWFDRRPPLAPIA